MAEFNLIQTKQDEFQDYLEKGEVLQTLAKILSDLFEEEEKPPNPIRYVKEKLEVTSVSPNELQEVKLKLEHAIEEMNTLIAENECLKDKISRIRQYSNNNNADNKEAAVDGNTDI